MQDIYSIYFKLKKELKGLDKYSEVLKNVDKIKKKCLSQVAKVFLQSVEKNFKSKGSYYGEKWQPLTRSTVIRKKGNSDILIRTGALEKGFVASVNEENGSVEVYNKQPYDVYHQTGAVIKKLSKKEQIARAKYSMKKEVRRINRLDLRNTEKNIIQLQKQLRIAKNKRYGQKKIQKTEQELRNLTKDFPANKGRRFTPTERTKYFFSQNKIGYKKINKKIKTKSFLKTLERSIKLPRRVLYKILDQDIKKAEKQIEVIINKELFK